MTINELQSWDNALIEDSRDHKRTAVYLRTYDGMTWEQWFALSEEIRNGLLWQTVNICGHDIKKRTNLVLDHETLYITAGGHTYLNALIWERGRFKYFQAKAQAERDGKEFVPPAKPQRMNRDITKWR